MGEPRRCYVWITGLPLSIPDRSFVLRRAFWHEDPLEGPATPPGFIASAENGEGDEARLVYWYGEPDHLDESVLEEHGCRAHNWSTGEWASPPRGYRKDGR